MQVSRVNGIFLRNSFSVMRLYFVFPLLVLRILSSSQYGVQIARTTPSLYSAVYRSFSTLSNKNNTSFSKFDELKADMKCRYLIAKDALKQCDNKDKVLFSAFTCISFVTLLYLLLSVSCRLGRWWSQCHHRPRSPLVGLHCRFDFWTSLFAVPPSNQANESPIQDGRDPAQAQCPHG